MIESYFYERMIKLFPGALVLSAISVLSIDLQALFCSGNHELVEPGL